MAYEKKVSRAFAALIIFLLDESKSMADMLHGTSDEKFKWVERYFGIMLQELLARCTEAVVSGVVIKPRYYISVIRYGSSVSVWGDEIMSIEDAALRFAESHNSLGLGGHLSGTDAQRAFATALDIVRKAIQDPRFRESFPPMMFHLTDGESQTDATDPAKEIMNLATTDGNVLIANAYIGAKTNLPYQGPDDFPGYASEAEAGPSSDNLRLFQMSSVMPETIRQNLIADGIFPKIRPNTQLMFDVRTKEMLKYVIQVVGSVGSRADRNRS
ncbi:MAG: VWA domain-containing protein [Planctomycetes bacterium]|nr:VWA domain-containing protein [Planctomycetota bacterium]